jgi:uncharacterized protein
MSAYWSWAVGGVALAGVAVAHRMAMGRTFGVSGAMDRVVHFRSERAIDRMNDIDVNEFELALRAATEAEFGQANDSVESATQSAAVSVDVVTPSTVVSQAFFVGAIFFGGLIAAITSGRFKVQTNLGPEFADTIASGWMMWPTLVFAGVLVGFGTRLAGGCTSGHGLSGCGRLQPASMVATASFLGSAIAVSLLFWKVL